MGQYGADGGSAALDDHDDARNGVQAGPLASSVMLPGLANGVLDALPDSLAVLDQSGTIVAVNRAWETFARENGGPDVATGSIGSNYLAVCRAASHDAIARQVLHGLRAILAGTELCFVLEYPCHSPTKQRWFRLRAVPLPGDQRSAVVVHTNITAQKLLELALTEQQRRYEALLASSPDHIFQLDVAGRFTFVNPAAAAAIGGASGRPADAIVGHTARELGLPPEFVRQFERQQARARAGKAVAAETPFPSPRGVRRFEYVLNPIYAEDGRLEALAGITRDIEERTRLRAADEAARREATRRAQELEAVFAAIPDGVVVFDEQGRVLRANALDQALVGDIREESVLARGRRLGLQAGDGVPLAEAQIPAARVLRGEVLAGEHTAEVSAAAPDGQRLELSVTGAPIRGACGEPAGGVLMYRDVTKERQATHHYQATIESAPDATVVATADGRIQLVNRRTEELFGYARAELLGQPVERLIPRRFHPAHRRQRAEYAAAPRTRPMGASLALFGRRRDGSEFPVEVSLSPLEDGAAQIIASIRDVSEVERIHAARREAEAANHDLHRLLTLTDSLQLHLELDEVLAELLRRVCDVMAVQNAVILLLADDGQQLVVRAAHGLEAGAHAEVTIPLGQGFAGRIAASRAPLVVDDLSAFPVVRQFLREHVRSAVGVPLVLRERVLGVLHVDTTEPRHFTEREVQLLQRVAERVALAVERAQLFAAERHARQDAEAALARALASEARFHRLVDSGIIGIEVGDRERVLEANDTYLQMLGYTRQDLQAGKLTRQALAPEPDMQAATERAVREALEQGQCRPIEREYVRRDGTRVPVLLGVALLERKPPRFVSFVVDLTELKRAEEAMRVSEDRLRLFVEHAPAAVAMFDREMRYVAVSARWLQDYGLHGDVIGRSHYDLLPEIPERWKAIHRRCLAGAIERCDEDVFERRDGSTQWIWWEVRPWYSHSHVIGGIVIFAEDITARKQLQLSLAEREQLYRATFEQAAVGMARVAPDGSWLDVNRRLCELVGYSREELAERTFQDLTHLDNLTADLESRRQLLAGERDRYATDKRYVRKDGTLIWVHLTVSLVRDAAGVPQYFVSVIEDISARKQAEREREDAEREREEARASELAAREVARQLDEFFATAAHDIRSPLTALIGNVDLARLRAERLVVALGGPDGRDEQQGGRDGTPAGRLLATLDNAGASSQRLRRLVTVLFDVSRARAGTLALTFAPCDLRTLVAEQVAAQLAATPGRTVALDLPDRPVVVQADADRLGQVLTNYLGNAVKYSAEDRPVAVRLAVAGGLAVVSVRDRGPGLPAEELPRVWELYHRAPGVTAHNEAGGIGGSLGLGLHVCKRLIELHPGGRVGVESVVGQGSTFWFRLPLAADRAPAAATASDACAT